jgi:hypothetical protein
LKKICCADTKKGEILENEISFTKNIVQEDRLGRWYM